jgi:hypothetical protein
MRAPEFFKKGNNWHLSNNPGKKGFKKDLKR